MKPASPALLALLADQYRQFYYCDLYTFTLSNGSLLYYTTADVDIIADAITYSAGGTDGALIVRDGGRPLAHWKIGTQVDSFQFDVIPQNAMVQGIPFLIACQQGVFDGATLQVNRAFMPSYGNTSDGTIVVFFGRVAEVDLSRSIATFTINSHLELFNQNMPRNVYQSNCVNTLYDTSCTLLKAAFTVTGSVVGGSTLSAINTNLSQATGFFDAGVITFTSGNNDGIARSVKAFVGGTPGVLNLLLPLNYIPSSGDAFTVYPGCDKTSNTCLNKFNNKVNFRGMPYIPEVSTAV